MSGNAYADLRNPVMFSRSYEQGMGGSIGGSLVRPLILTPRAPVLVAAVACVGHLASCDLRDQDCESGAVIGIMGR